MDQKEIYSRLNEITSYFNFYYIIAIISFKDFCGTLKELAYKNPHNHLNKNELALLVGFWLKNANKSKALKYDDIEKILTEVYDLMEKLHLSFLKKKSTQELDVENSLFGDLKSGKNFQESMFYGSDQAYDFQYSKWFESKYKYDSKWLEDSKCIDIKIMPEFYRNFKKNRNAKLNRFVNEKDGYTSNDLVDAFCSSEEDLTMGDARNINLLKPLITSPLIEQNKGFNEIGDFNVFTEKPIIQIGIDKYFIPLSSNVPEALYESPYYWMYEDQEYKSQAMFNRGEVAEEITFDLVKSVFGEEQTVKNLIIKKNRGSMVTDVDVLGLFW